MLNGDPRDIGDDTDNEATSKLTQEVHAKNGQTSRMEIFQKQFRMRSANLSEWNSNAVFNRVLNVSGLTILLVKPLQRN